MIKNEDAYKDYIIPAYHMNKEHWNTIIVDEKVFSKIGKENNITLHACCEKEYLKDYGLDITGCMSQEIVEKVI